MSKKNNQGTRRNQHSFDLQREAELKKKQAKKAEKQQRKLAARPELRKKTKQNKGIRIKKNVVIAGIKIKDSASKLAAKEALAARKQVTAMHVDDDN